MAEDTSPGRVRSLAQRFVRQSHHSRTGPDPASTVIDLNRSDAIGRAERAEARAQAAESEVVRLSEALARKEEILAEARIALRSARLALRDELRLVRFDGVARKHDDSDDEASAPSAAASESVRRSHFNGRGTTAP